MIISKLLRCFSFCTMNDIHFLLIQKILYQIDQILHDMISVKLKMIFHLSLMLFWVTMKKLHSWFLDELLFFIYVYVVYFQKCLSRRIEVSKTEDYSRIFSERSRMKMQKLLRLMHRIILRNKFWFYHYVK